MLARKRPQPTRLTRPSITHVRLGVVTVAIALLLLCAEVTNNNGVRAQSSGVCPTWSYTGQYGPDHWGSLCVQWLICSNGKEQSPVDLSNFLRASVSLSALSLSYPANPNTNLVIAHNGNTLETRWPDDGFLSKGPLVGSFNLHSILYHSPSEHTISGQALDIEAQFIHFSNEGYMTIFALLFQAGSSPRSSPFLSHFYTHLPNNASSPATTVKAFDIQAFLSDALSEGYYYYQGSLTVPPCTQGVNWIIPRKMLPCSREEVRAFANVLNNNIRPVQALNERFVLEYVPVHGLEDWIFDERSWYIKVLVGLGMFLFLSLIVAFIYAANGFGSLVNRRLKRKYTAL
eukprot:TRINITY_DN6656_c0_g1_i1.p1 TRINITY_DN6656_c0_g1~~TRINITY_DN6656_c0_g1_i1.p1  ORF type:complete len:345 (+),score=32.89 TRINITY_DN6656_c0_g1_i1:116-1150(+)